MNVTSTLDAVTIYREGAVCVRKASVKPKDGPVPAQLRLVGLPMALSGGSLRARVLQGAATLRVLDVRAAFDVTLADEVDVPLEVQALEKAREEVARLRVAEQRVATELTELQGLRPRFLEPKRGEPPREAPVAAMLALADFAGGQLEQRLEAQRALRKSLEDAEEEVALRERRLSEASATRRSERARVTRAAVVTLSGQSQEAVELALEYQVPGARWAPSYALALEQGFTGGALRLRASVAQNTGEDWAGVALALSTASLDRRTDVPELKALKIGRRQAPPPRSGWREPPAGLDELFHGYDTARPPPPTPASVSAGSGGMPQAEVAERAKFKKSAARPPMAPGGPPPPAPPPMAAAAMPQAAPAAMRLRREAPPLMARAPAPKRAFGAGAQPDRAAAFDDAPPMEELAESDALSLDDGEPPEPAEPPPLSPQAELMDYDRLVMPGPAAPARRGRLQPASEWEFAFAVGVVVQVDVVVALINRALAEAQRVGSLPLPAGCQPPRPLQSFDYRYDCAQRLDVPSNAQWVVVPVMECAVALSPEYVCVPSVEQKVYRTLQVKNAGVHALLPGPVDVSAGDDFLLTAQLPPIAPGADAQRLGLGVEEAIKVARKTTYQETSGGFLGGSTVLPHELEIEINNRLGSPARLEVRERVPYAPPGEKDLKVEETAVNPPWEKLELLDGEVLNGARRWRLTVPPGSKQVLTAQYAIRMPADKMLVGGNRRV